MFYKLDLYMNFNICCLIIISVSLEIQPLPLGSIRNYMMSGTDLSSAMSSDREPSITESEEVSERSVVINNQPKVNSVLTLDIQDDQNDPEHDPDHDPEVNFENASPRRTTFFCCLKRPREPSITGQQHSNSLNHRSTKL